MHHRAGRIALLVLALLISQPGFAQIYEFKFDQYIWTQYSSTFPLILQTQPIARYSFNESACGERVQGAAEFSVPQTFSGT